MSNTWKYLGFRKSPYDATPLKACQEDVELLVGRQDEMTDLCTILASNSNGIAIISGPPGVGKTSFFNVSQYLLEIAQTAIGPRLMCNRILCAVNSEDKAIDVARRALNSLIRSVEEYCALNKTQTPPETSKLSRWLGDIAVGAQLEIILRNRDSSQGRTISLPRLKDATFERIGDAIQCVVNEITDILGFEGTIIALDNLENINEETASDLLMNFRDTLFTSKNLWWILIGQAGFGGLMQSINPRVYERITGTSIDLQPITFKDLHHAIERRVHKFHDLGDGKAPLHEDVHRHLYNASHGEIRFVFKYSSDTCIKIISSIVHSISAAHRAYSLEITRQEVYKSLGRIMIQNQIPADRAESVLKLIIKDEISALKLKPKEIEVLRLIGEIGESRPGMFSKFGLKTAQDFSANYLLKMHRQNLLVRFQAGKAVFYKLRGVAALAHEYGLLQKFLAS